MTAVETAGELAPREAQMPRWLRMGRSRGPGRHLGPAVIPGMAGPTGSTSSRPSLETATGASTAVPPSAVSHGLGLTGRIAERHSPPCQACPQPGRARR